MKLFRHAFLALSLSLLAACAVHPPVPVVELDYEARSSELVALEQWSLSGRAAITTAADAGTISLDWRQVGERYSVSLRAPWGAGNVRVEGGPGAVMLRTGDGIEDFAAEPGVLLEHYTGVDLPLESLRYWLLGVPDPAAEASVALDEQGLVSELRQHGWRLDYRRYGQFAGLVLPTTVFMRGDGVEVRVAIRQWEIGS